MNDTVEGLLQIENVPVVGLLLAIIAVLIYFVIQLRKEIKEKDKEIADIRELRIQEQKEYTKDMLSISERVSGYVQQLQDMFKLQNHHE